MIGLATALLLSTLASATPVPQERTASVVSVGPRRFHTHPTKVFDREAFRRERMRLRAKYGAPKAAPETIPLRREVEAIEAFDIQEMNTFTGKRCDDKKDDKSGADELQDADESDERECTHGNTTKDIDKSRSLFWQHLK